MGPYEQFHELSRFHEDIRSKMFENRVCLAVDYKATWKFFLGKEVFIFQIIATGCVTPKYLFSPDCSLKTCEKPSKFSENVHVVNDYTDTMST